MKDDAASEVIGVILIVAITVVIAAVVAAFAFGMNNSIKKPHAVYFTIDRNNINNDVTITNIGGPDISLLIDPVEISYTDSSGTQTGFDNPVNIISTSGGLASGDLSKLSTTQLTLDPTMIKPDGQCHIVIRGTFTDGTQQVLMQSDI